MESGSLLVFVLVFSVCSADVKLSRANPEVRVLMEVKAALDPEGRRLPSWTSEGDPCHGNFEGVACNEDGKVTNISLQGKGLAGSISPAVAGLKCLNGLYLHYNALNGGIPKEIANLTELSDLYLNVNNLSGSIPVEIGNMTNLQVLQLCYNKFTGSIPTQLGSLKKLGVLALQFNHLTGAIPASLGDLPQLTRLDLSFNFLFGSVPATLARIPLLGVLDLRNNSLSGNVPSGLRRLGEGFQYGNNHGLCGGYGFDALEVCNGDDPLEPNKPEPFGPNSTVIRPQQIPRSASHYADCKNSVCSSSKSSKGVVTVGVIIVAVCGALCSLSAFSWYRRRKQRIGSSLEISDGRRLSTDRPGEVCRRSGSSPLISLEYSNGWDPLSVGSSSYQEVARSFRFNLEEVECATQYFCEVNLLGKSNFAATYRGILRDGTIVAIRSISKMSCKTEEAEFLEGLKVMTLLRHENLVALRGFCCSRVRGECFLVYDYVAKGSLSQYLDVKEDNAKVVLDWSTRVAIIRGIAKGIEYLHSNKVNKPSLVHQNISAEKILLDQHFSPRLSGCGLHKLLADDVIFSTLKSSAAMGYLAPEYTTTGRFNEKSDVYAFGVILFQILSGESKVSHLRSGAHSGKLDDLLDDNLHGKYYKPEAAKLIGIALLCTSEIANQRPTMEAVLQQLGPQ